MTPSNNTIVFLVYGMRRSGLHCIVYDIIDNYNIEHPNKLVLKNNISFLTYPVNNKVWLFEDKFKLLKSSMNKQIDIIIIRDIYNNMISRIHKSNKELHTNLYKIDNKYLTTYKAILKELLGITNNYPNKIVIRYDLYIKDTNYRRSILKNIINTENIKTFSNKIPLEGGGTSFKKGEKREDTKININIYNLIKLDIEFIDLVRKYYKYDILEKLSYHL